MAEILGRKLDPKSIEDIQRTVDRFAKTDPDVERFNIPRTFVFPVLSPKALSKLLNKADGEPRNILEELLQEPAAAAPITLSANRIVYNRLPLSSARQSDEMIRRAVRNVRNINKLSLGFALQEGQVFTPVHIATWLDNVISDVYYTEPNLFDIAYTPLNGEVSSPRMARPQAALLGVIQECVSVIHAGPLMIQDPVAERLAASES